MVCVRQTPSIPLFTKKRAGRRHGYDPQRPRAFLFPLVKLRHVVQGFIFVHVHDWCGCVWMTFNELHLRRTGFKWSTFRLIEFGWFETPAETVLFLCFFLNSFSHKWEVEVAAFQDPNTYYFKSLRIDVTVSVSRSFPQIQAHFIPITDELKHKDTSWTGRRRTTSCWDQDHGPVHNRPPHGQEPHVQAVTGSSSTHGLRTKGHRAVQTPPPPVPTGTTGAAFRRKRQVVISTSRLNETYFHHFPASRSDESELWSWPNPWTWCF